jgi:hypothetical protein
VIDDQLQRDWLDAVSTDLAIEWVVGPRIPDFGNADLLGVLTPVTGPGPVLEGINTVVGFQLRMVAREHDYAKLKNTANTIHRALLFADVPADIWGTRVVWIDVAGGDPVPEPADGRDLDRVAFTCTYLAEVAL